MSIRVLIADDQPLMRAALRMCLESDPGITVVAEAVDGRHDVELAGRLRPDVAMLDIRMPSVDGTQATRRIVELPGHRPIRVLVITGFDPDEHLVEALRSGASGFLTKDASGPDILTAVKVIADGGALLAPSVTRMLIDRYARFLPRQDPAGVLGGRLTQREITVLQLVCRGWANAEIAQSLHIAPSSVKTHVGHLLSKLSLPDRVHLVIFGYENGLVQPNSPPAAGD